MAPIRRYLRISKYSVLECRIYLENPADSRWLLDSRDPVLPRVFQSIRPLVLPKLREENERARAKKKSKPVKDVLVEGSFNSYAAPYEFEVSIFLRETGTRHAIAMRHKSFQSSRGISGNASKLAGSNDEPIQIADDDDDDNDGIDHGEHPATVVQLMTEDDDAPINLADIPEALAADAESGDEQSNPRRRRRRRRHDQDTAAAPAGGNDETPPRAAKRNKTETRSDGGVPSDDKKLGIMSTTYDGFNIWGWILCLLITRKDNTNKAKSSTKAAGEQPSNQALMEEWICTQAPPGV
ncbi:hypothetical protein LOZ58_003248 [Ophidiomyces ophidiicola]|nr:hypothetical protein LOZ58_003248 [Ophidiomyces ophidiicola]